MKKEVRIINMVANKFGIFEALELDLQKFTNGVLAIKGQAGMGKSTVQKAFKISTQGRKTLDDATQYGDAWEVETQLIDGDRKVFIGAYKKAGRNEIEFKLFEKDDKGKKVFTPVIDGMKATPAKYMELISTELTFGIKDFLSENNTTHKKFMFALFRSELEKLGVIFDKKHPDYQKSILGKLDELTDIRDNLRNECTHLGAFATDFKRDGHTLEELGAYEPKDLKALNESHTNLLIKKGQADGNSTVEYEKKRTAKASDGSAVVELIRAKINELEKDFNKESDIYKSFFKDKVASEEALRDIETGLFNAVFLGDTEKKGSFASIRASFDTFFKFPPINPIAPICPEITNNSLKTVEGVEYHADFLPLIAKHRQILGEYMAIVPEAADMESIEKEIAASETAIQLATLNNSLVERYNKNRDWVKSDALVAEQRKELTKLYAQINTGVKGLRMKPFFDDEKGTFDIKTVYTGEFDFDFFKPKTKELASALNIVESQDKKNLEGVLKAEKDREQLLISYSSTQQPIIGVLLQVARLKLKEKALPYIFIDDVPMDLQSRKILTKIAKDNGLIILTSITGDFDRKKLSENELIVEGGEVFFSE